MKNYIVTIFLFISFEIFSLGNLIPDNKDSIFDGKPKFIVISHVGASDYFVAPIVISCDSIKGSLYKKGNYSQHLKFNGYTNYIIDSSAFSKLYSNLNLYKSSRERKLDFTKTEKNILIVDFRNKMDIDFELLSLTEISTTVYFIKNLYCFFISNGYDKKIISHLEFMYSGILKYYDRKGEIYESNLICK